MKIVNVISLLLLTCITFVNYAEVNNSISDNTNDSNYLKQDDIIDKVESEYIKSFGVIESTISEPPIKIAEEKRKKMDPSNVKPPQMDEAMVRQIVFENIFKKSDRLSEYCNNTKPILNKYALRDLKMFYGTLTNRQMHLLSRLNNAQTVIGECALAVSMVTPTDDISELIDRQNIISTFLEDEELCDKATHYISLFHDIEQSFISLFSETDPLYSSFYDDYMGGLFYFSKGSKYNKSAVLLEIKKRFINDWLIIMMPFIITTSSTCFECWSSSPNTFKFGDSLLRYVPFGNIFANKEFWPIYLLYDIGWTISFSVAISKYKEYHTNIKNLAMRMRDIKVFLYVITKLNQLIKEHDTLGELFNNKTLGINELLYGMNNKSKKLKSCITYLKSLPLHNMKYMFNNCGKLLAAFKIFEEYKQDFVDAIYELGYIDSMISVSILMKKASEYNDTHTYNFVKYKDKSMTDNTPYVKVKEMWNPFLDSQKAIGNSFEFGEKSKTGLLTMILTGPNAGGKSTGSIGLTISIWMAQVWGIAPVDEMEMTPFARINTYVDITDDIAAGKSLFEAKVDRVMGHIDLVSSLNKDEFSFSCFDEPFNATEPMEGSAVEYAVLEHLAKYKNCLNVVSTHYPMTMLLEEKSHDNGFRNYKVFITKTLENEIVYHYKIIPGRSTQTIAIDILEKFGYDTSLLKRARDILKNPQNYESSF